MSVVIDASVFVAASRTNEPHFAESVRFLRDLKNELVEIYCPTLLLPECAGAIARATGSMQLAHDLIGLIETYPKLLLVPLTQATAQRTAVLASRHKLRGADAIYVTLANELRSILVTWDGEMLGRGAASTSTMTPTQWLARPSANQH